MNRKIQLKITLTAGLIFLALGGFLLHTRAHPLGADEENVIPFVTGVISVVFVPLMFWFRKTAAYAYVINGFLVILGTITMTHFSLAHLKSPVTVQTVLLNTTFSDIMLLWGRFAIGKALFDIQFLHSDADTALSGRFFRYPNMGWWWVHFVGVTLMYALGNILWK